MAKTAAERQRDKRKRDIGRDVTSIASATLPELDKALADDTASLEHYKVFPDKYVPRREPELLNWGPWLNMAQLETAGLKANRVSVPGDWDYK